MKVGTGSSELDSFLIFPIHVQSLRDFRQNNLTMLLFTRYKLKLNKMNKIFFTLYGIIICCLFTKCDKPMLNTTRQQEKIVKDSLTKQFSTIASSDELYQIAEKINQLTFQDSQTAWLHRRVGKAFYDNQLFSKTKNHYEKALTIQLKETPSDTEGVAKTYFWLARANRRLLNLNSALENAQKGAALIDNFSLLKKDWHKTWRPFYIDIADIYAVIGDFQRSIDFTEHILNRTQQYQDQEGMAWSYERLGATYSDLRQFEKSIYYLEKALMIDKDSALEAQTKHNLAFSYRHLGQYDKAIALLNSTIPIFKTQKKYEYIANSFVELAQATFGKKDFKAASNWVYSSLYSNLKWSPSKAVESYQVLGEIAEAQQKPDSALCFYQKALQIIDTTFKSNDVLINPTIDAKTFNRKIELIYLLEHKAYPLSILYKKTKNKAYLMAALNTYQLADKSVQVLRREMQDDQSKYFWNETALPIYKKGIDVAYQLFELTQDAQYKLTMLQFSERTKAPVLREGIADNQAKSFAGVPATERQRERELRATIAILENQMTQDPKLTGQLAQTRTQLYTFQDSLKIKYPTYARYLAATTEDKPLSIKDLKSIQNKLSDTTLLVEYAFGNHHLYQIALSNADFQIFKTPLTPDFYTQIDRFNYAVNDYDAIKKDFNATGRAYAATSFDLYQRLLEQPLTHTQHATNLKKNGAKVSAFTRIHLILDNQLHLFPFKALTDTSVKGWMGDFPEHFLVKNYAFSSLFSIQTLLKTTPSVAATDTANLKLACFGLDFKDTTIWRQKTSPTTIKTKKNNVLVRAESEITGIAKQFNGRFYFNREATKDVFLKDAPQYDFLHITTHGYPEGLVFQKSNATDSLHEVSISDIYGLPLHTRFTFLSACETGQGKLTEAEGVMSLGRAFSFAGSQSVIMSLWSIPDGSTSKIAQSFYTYYHQGVPKDVAEQRAEIDFLSTALDAQTLPNHWAALTIIGDMSPLEQPQTGSNRWAWGLLACITFLGLLFVVKSKKINIDPSV
jgi:CHAT domain-containing protein/tetratricopeptide (TPR) repeat protein